MRTAHAIYVLPPPHTDITVQSEMFLIYAGDAMVIWKGCRARGRVGGSERRRDEISTPISHVKFSGFQETSAVHFCIWKHQLQSVIGNWVLYLQMERKRARNKVGLFSDRL